MAVKGSGTWFWERLPQEAKDHLTANPGEKKAFFAKMRKWRWFGKVEPPEEEKSPEEEE